MDKKPALDHIPTEHPVRRVPINGLRPNPRNPRSISSHQLKSLCRSMEQDPDFMTMRPLLATPDGTVIAGNQRLRAARELGWTELPVIFAEMDAVLAGERALRDNGSDHSNGECPGNALYRDFRRAVERARFEMEVLMSGYVVKAAAMDARMALKVLERLD